MPRQQRLVFAGLAVLVAIVAVVFLAGGSEGEPETAATPATPAATATPDGGAEETTTPAPAPEPVVIEVLGGTVQGGPVDIDVEQGDRVRFSVRSDAADHVHVHGYDVLRDVPSGGRASFDFKATIPGVFEVELEEAGVEVARLRVEQ